MEPRQSEVQVTIWRVFWGRGGTGQDKSLVRLNDKCQVTKEERRQSEWRGRQEPYYTGHHCHDSLRLMGSHQFYLEGNMI